jgi:lipoyl(octanoyl) transferase
MPFCQIYSFPGLVDYVTAWQWQLSLAQQRAEGKIPDTLLLLEHPATITLGRRSHPEDLFTSRETLAARGVAVIDSDRGGEITYHAPGQLVGYPIVDLREHGQDLHRYLRDLEEVIIQALAAFGITGTRKAGMTGVWVMDRKIAALGIKVTRWISLHGFALNISLDLSPPRRDFIPCGIRDYGVTSLAEACPERLWGRADVEDAVLGAFAGVFHVSLFCARAGILSP